MVHAFVEGRWIGPQKDRNIPEPTPSSHCDPWVRSISSLLFAIRSSRSDLRNGHVKRKGRNSNHYGCFKETFRPLLSGICYFRRRPVRQRPEKGLKVRVLRGVRRLSAAPAAGSSMQHVL